MLEKEKSFHTESEPFDFFNKQEKKDEPTRLDTPKIQSDLMEQITKHKFLSKFKKITGIKFSNFIILPSILTFFFGALSVGFILNHFIGFGSIFIVSALFPYLFYLTFKLSLKLTDAEIATENREGFLPYVSDLEYVLEKFSKDYNIKASYRFPNNTYSSFVIIDVEQNGKNHELTWLYKDFIKSYKPYEWYDRMKSSLSVLVMRLEGEEVERKLEIIKSKNMDTWFELTKKMDSESINKCYLELTQN